MRTTEDCEWGPGDSLWESALSFHHAGPWSTLRYHTKSMIQQILKLYELDFINPSYFCPLKESEAKLTPGGNVDRLYV